MGYRLVVGDVSEFPVRFVMNDAGAERTFAFRLRAKRMPAKDLEALLVSSTQTMREFVARAEFDMALLEWIGPAPLKDDEGKEAPADMAALGALYDLQPAIPGLTFAAYAEANGAKGKLGN